MPGRFGAKTDKAGQSSLCNKELLELALITDGSCRFTVKGAHGSPNLCSPEILERSTTATVITQSLCQ